MSLYLDRKYLAMSSARLRNFKQKTDDSWNFSCPFCGDSQRNQLKARGYMFKAKEFNGMAYHCHNCNISTNFTTFLKHLDPLKYKEYIMEKFQAANGAHLLIPPEKVAQAKVTWPEAPLQLCDIELPSISDLPLNHFAKEYIVARKIPLEYWPEIFFADDYKAFLDRVWPNHGKDKLPEKDPRIVLFYTNLRGGITNVSGRSFTADPKLRYITVKVTEERKVYGLHRLKTDRPVYVTEGQFDSMFLPNAVAAGDSNLPGLADWLYDTLGVKPVIIYDREPRNREITKQINKSILNGWDVVLMPENFPGKDLNDLVVSGLSIDEVTNLVTKYTYQGLQAQLEFVKWKKC